MSDKSKHFTLYNGYNIDCAWGSYITALMESCTDSDGWRIAGHSHQDSPGAELFAPFGDAWKQAKPL